MLDKLQDYCLMWRFLTFKRHQIVFLRGRVYQSLPGWLRIAQGLLVIFKQWYFFHKYRFVFCPFPSLKDEKTENIYSIEVRLGIQAFILVQMLRLAQLWNPFMSSWQRKINCMAFDRLNGSQSLFTHSNLLGYWLEGSSIFNI